jgi:hypothetical protein
VRAIVDGDEVSLKPRFVSVKDAGLYLGRIVPREVYRLLAAGDLEAVSHGRRRLVTVASLEAYGDRLLDQLKQPAETAA